MRRQVTKKIWRVNFKLVGNYEIAKNLDNANSDKANKHRSYKRKSIKI